MAGWEDMVGMDWKLNTRSEQDCMNNRVIHYANEGQVFAAESCGAHFEVESLSLESCFKFQVHRHPIGSAE